MDHTGAIDTEDEAGPLAHLAPSPQSEAVAHEFQELSLQSSQNLPPLNERKNGNVVFWESGLQSPLLTQSVSMVKFLIYGLCV
ncbi:myocardin-related transcription factor B isoform X5 [Pongo pygmaeus]|uniref:myocardin-related transcription factor B isoform X5 n=1 Tax=Pongo pygmaeus TaxID=9600 RepID=UPI0023E24F01|nr:myocardin-related transcription factor B isoform X4 [Pongo pygmaeus]XP_054310903.1 myocardin-related transcription factor B isoform X4 [Pongo pygmaeus]XP_054310904.1 myocardin-related transcription factor B isoform X4 [Pongo pygmaeus]XP_054310905.1 myocardin-related transcription factor B isoform X4 [Pongo pygmaeus]XP_054310906.1 myocardin-related transcription factor B isoform X4 [Pongo pygmaeus]XP_054389468.1 myocardin-related transcription factor B isoform X4 [Pongo abelii]XP_054389469.